MTMVTIDMDEALHKALKDFLAKDKIEYPTMTNFVEKAVRDKLRIELINQKESFKYRNKSNLTHKDKNLALCRFICIIDLIRLL